MICTVFIFSDVFSKIQAGLYFVRKIQNIKHLQNFWQLREQQSEYNLSKEPKMMFQNNSELTLGWMGIDVLMFWIQDFYHLK